MNIAFTDFIGFKFNGHHSSEMNFYRVSDGNRYNETMLPAFQDKTVAVPGGDGTYFFDSFYTNKTFAINIAFDSMTESDIRTLRQVFNGKDIGDLIFDEAPYKAYSAKVQNPPQLKYICFDEGGERIYKGEGTINFICYYPYAHSVHKYLSEYSGVANLDEWKAASKMKAAKGTYDGVGTNILLYNAGDIEADWCAYYINNSGNITVSQIDLEQDDVTIGTLTFSTITPQGNSDSWIRVNSRTNLVEGCDSNKKPTGTLYNKFITSGSFFKIPLGESNFKSTVGQNESSDIEIEYEYLYY